MRAVIVNGSAFGRSFGFDRMGAYLIVKEKGTMLYIDGTIIAQVKCLAHEHGVSWETILAIGIQESGWNPNAVGDNGDSIGAMQIHYPSHPEPYAIPFLFLLPFNIDQGCRIYRACVEATESREDAVSAYNQGIAGWREHGRSVNAGYWQNVCALRQRILDEGLQPVDGRSSFAWE